MHHITGPSDTIATCGATTGIGKATNVVSLVRCKACLEYMLPLRLPTGELMMYAEPFWETVRACGPCSVCGAPQSVRPLVACDMPGGSRLKGVCAPCIHTLLCGTPQ